MNPTNARWTLAALALCWASFAHAAKPTVVAPTLPAAKGVTAPVAQGFDAHLRGVLGKQATLISAKATEAALKAAKVKDACGTDTCGEALAKAAKARFVLTGSVVNNDEIYEVKFSLYDQALHTRTEKKSTCELCAVEEVDGTITKVVGELSAALSAPMPAPAPAKPATPAMVSVTITTAPEGAAVTIDDVPVGKTPYEGKVKAGKHSLTLKKEGFLLQERTINALDKPVTIALTLVVDLNAGLKEDEPIGSSLEPPKPALPPVAAGGNSHTGAAVGMVIGGAVLAGVGTWLIVLDGEITCDDGRSRTECPNVYNTKGAGIAGLGVGAGLIGASIATFILDAMAPSAPSAPAPSVAPTANGGAIFQLGGRF